MAEANVIERGRWKFAANYNHNDGCLPQELTTEILLRLPTKSLVRFKLVSKLWSFLISNPNFIKSHSLNPNNMPLTLLYDSKYRLLKSVSLGKRDENLNLNPTVLEVNPCFLYIEEYLYDGILGSCHGLICTYSNQTKLIYLCNPLTKETKEISFPNPKIISYDCKDIRNMSWFDFVPSINDYKILLVFGTRTSNLRIHVYSMKDNKWRELNTSDFKSLVITGGYIGWERNVALINEKLHFVCFNFNHRTQFIAKFDLVQDIFELMPIILNDNNNNYRYCYGEFVDIVQGTISIHGRGRYILPGGSWVMEAWKLEKLFSLELSGFPIGFTSCGGLILRRPNPDDNHEYELVFVDLTQNPPSQIQLGRSERARYMLDYVETLVSPFSLP
ncbi:F-box/kelch-repeat protein At3g23880-like [Spinacia oleracea]|uniref:F-box/kelch-repeat protein At3g23880-like n=1 Tax=Spinacia oleracea TaxID=3562 RepID=A0ABM3REB6_SPIOL|nr:F-box/kelch-repeat protein At3g23880-like [Spinacia oleracea]